MIQVAGLPARMTDGETGPNGFVVALLTAVGQRVGVGFLVGSGDIITCAHVVNVALGRGMRAQERPTGRLTVEFPLLPDVGGWSLRVTAKLLRWVAPPRDGVVGEDIACLRLDNSCLPDGAAPAALAAGPVRAGQVVDVFGYPNAPPRPDGAWVEAVVRGLVAGGRLQLDAAPGTALRIQPGYSGSPIYDRVSGLVVGMLVAAPARVSSGTPTPLPSISSQRRWQISSPGPGTRLLLADVGQAGSFLSGLLAWACPRLTGD